MPSTAILDPITVAEEAEKERAQVESEGREIEVLLKQTNNEIDRLVQRQTEAAQKLRQLEANLEAYPRDEIKNTYAASQDAQMRLFMMRNQLEQLQNKQRALQRYRGQLDRLSMTARQLAENAHSVVVSSTDTDQSAESKSIIQIIEAQELERQHLSRQMHDGPAQSLTNLILQAEIVQRLFDTDQARARAELGNLKTSANSTFQRIRDFIFDLRPMMLDDLGLMPTLKRYVQTFESKNHLPTHLAIIGERTLPSYIEVAIFRAVQELMNNVARHAHATHIQISVDLSSDTVLLTVEDDGNGFDVEAVMSVVRQRGSSGLANLDKRIQMLGGRVQFQSTTGRGTKARVELPAAR